MAKQSNDLAPDRRPITELQAKRLATISGLNQKELVNLSVAEITERFKWKIDLELLMFRRICGRVVKKDPITGIEYPVPFATVHVEDTDCSFLGFSTIESPWAWYFPIFCHREEIATTVTDACGRFCVYVPRWEIDWILRFRRQRICFPDSFIKPSIRDLLERLESLPDKWSAIRPPQPEPDPAPFLLRDGGLTLRRTEAVLGRHVARKLAALEHGSSQSNANKVTALHQRQLLDTPAFTNRETAPAPPLPEKLRNLSERTKPEEIQALARELKVDAKQLAKLNPNRFVGPFFRCVDMWVANWVPILDVPDITFRVTQDVDGDGDQETIYSENYFDVRWNAGAIPNVTLEASPIAVAAPASACDTPDVPCKTPGIVMAGLMPLENLPTPADPYLDSATGYARRPNRPHPSGELIDPLPNPLATAPFTGTLQLYGCNQFAGAQFYRLRYAYQDPTTLALAAPVPFVNLSWNVFRWIGTPGHLEIRAITPDADGWYPILNPADGWMPGNLLLNWPTSTRGLYRIDMQLANASRAVLHTTTPTDNLKIDNTSPTALFTGLAWRVAGTAAWTNLELICPVVRRPAGVDIEFRVSYQASAIHLRSMSLSGGGCGGGDMQRLASPNWSEPASAVNPYEHWHTDPTDNSVARTAIFRLPGTAQQGAYSFNLAAFGRAFNPSGGDGGFEADWNYDPIYAQDYQPLPVAVVNA